MVENPIGEPPGSLTPAPVKGRAGAMDTMRFELTRAEFERGRLLRRATYAWSGALPGVGEVRLTCPRESWHSGRSRPPG
ncbi:hypothetical protein SHKM778_75480 [Streptomyces sp. KM77-8]|uniref:Uncharacterized protein n=1 Tax=Streptomyces haneummycinicus TaxID=3074435 RepID=A0AAT9HUI9_9ACTN